MLYDHLGQENIVRQRVVDDETLAVDEAGLVFCVVRIPYYNVDC